MAERLHVGRALELIHSRGFIVAGDYRSAKMQLSSRGERITVVREGGSGQWKQGT